MEKKQKEKREKKEEDLKRIGTETEIWRYINRKNEKKIWVENRIRKEEWRNHFMRLLDGVEVGAAIEVVETKEGEKIKETIEEEEIKRANKKNENEKGRGNMVDGIPMEAWRYAGKEKWMDLVELIRDIWKKGTLPKNWRKSSGTIIQERRKGEGNYRGISLLCTAYKIYAKVLRCKLEREVKERKLVPDSQAEFRRGKSTIDNVWVLNHLLLRDKKEEIYILLADIRAAFDNMDREIFWKDLRKKGINRQLIEGIEKIYEDTEVVVRTREGYIEENSRQEKM